MRSKLNRTTQNCTVYETGRRNLPNEQRAFQIKQKNLFECNLSTPSKLTALWPKKKRFKESYLLGPFAKLLGSSPSPSRQIEKISGGQTLASAKRKSANIFDLSANRKSVNFYEIQYGTANWTTLETVIKVINFNDFCVMHRFEEHYMRKRILLLLYAIFVRRNSTYLRTCESFKSASHDKDWVRKSQNRKTVDEF
jgi:hypothetical protein